MTFSKNVIIAGGQESNGMTFLSVDNMTLINLSLNDTPSSRSTA